MEPTMVTQKRSIEDFQLPAAILWPLTVLAWVAAGVLVLATLLLALVGYLNAWWVETRDRHLGSSGEILRGESPKSSVAY